MQQRLQYGSESLCYGQVSPQAALFPRDLYQSQIRRTALCDYLMRSFGEAVSAAGADVRTESGGWHGQKGGEMTVDTPGQHVLQRTSCMITDEVRVIPCSSPLRPQQYSRCQAGCADCRAGLKPGSQWHCQPGDAPSWVSGRPKSWSQICQGLSTMRSLQCSIQEGIVVVSMPCQPQVCRELPMGIHWDVDRYVRAGQFYGTQDAEALRRHVDCVEDTDALRKALPGLGLVAFVGNGSVLPRLEPLDTHKLATCM